MAAKPKAVPLALIVWANITKWQAIRDVDDNEIAILLGLSRLNDRKRNLSISASEMEKIANYLAIEPERLLER